MYDMYEILTQVFVSAAGALMWCLLITFCCMCIEHLFFKKQVRPRLTDKEIILIREVLAGHISLPLVANDGLFVECVDRIEQIFERFIIRSKQQTERLEEISKALDTKYFEDKPRNDFSLESFPIEVPVDLAYPEEELVSGASFQEILNRISPKYDNIGTTISRKVNEALLADSIRIIDIPKNCRRILQKKMGCESVKDVLELMLRIGSRKDLLKIYGIGEIAADRLERFMFDTGLIYLQGYTYQSDYVSIENLNNHN